MPGGRLKSVILRESEMPVMGGPAPEEAMDVWRSKCLPPTLADESHDMHLAVCGQKMLKMDLFSESDPFIKVFYLEKDKQEIQIVKYFEGDKLQVIGSGIWTFLGETTWMKDEPNPVFLELFSLKYNPDMIQRFRIEVYDYDYTSTHDFIGAAEFSVSEILSTPSSTYTKPMKNVKERKSTGYLSAALFDSRGLKFTDARLGFSTEQVPF
mmetsp:Transcript_7167/g.21864  ORF Transcript_7167/g.21864 Transcript_7167/m.21864 type:complete len:210 (+) Transcript_7167:60-689(+)